MILHEFGRASRVSEFANSGSHKLLRQRLVLKPTDAASPWFLVDRKRSYRLNASID